MIKNIICDLDSTLVDSGKHYIIAQQQLGELIENETGVKKDIVIELSKHIDLQSIKIDEHFKKERFPTSFKITSAAIDMILDMPINHERIQKCYNIANNVYDAIPEVLEGGIEFLQYFTNKQYNIFLWTKGNATIQNKKIEDCGLSPYFKQSNIYVVTKKDAESLNHIINAHNLNKEECVVLGDSKVDDINSAYKAGIKSIWVNNGVKTGWNYDQNSVHLWDWSIKHLNEVCSIIEAYNK